MYDNSQDHAPTTAFQQVPGSQQAFMRDAEYVAPAYDQQKEVTGLDMDSGSKGPLLPPEHMDIDHNSSQGGLPPDPAITSDKFEASPLPQSLSGGHTGTVSALDADKLEKAH